eukprot:gb/GEZN01009749.1/.p1 GENE.gb/GEZN01009749.1/~~gb/GEZN01009749.1/.p1  ORF type:complete len:313 (+),score=36.67 gb/GEZN01009749.1/:74-1012(+)
MFGMEQSKRIGRKYSIYSAIKFIVAATFLLVQANQKKNMIQGYYNQERCSTCLTKARADQETMYEFGACSQYFPEVNEPNLFVAAELKAKDQLNESRVAGYVVLGGVTFALAAVMGCVYFFLGLLYNGALLFPYVIQLMYGSIMIIGFLMHLAGILMELYIKNECYVSPWDRVHDRWDRAVYLLFLATFVVAECVPASPSSFYVSFLLSVSAFILYSIFAGFSAYHALNASHEPDLMIFTILATLSVFELPLVLVGYPVLKRLLSIRMHATPWHQYDPLPGEDIPPESPERRYDLVDEAGLEEDDIDRPVPL